MQITFGLALDGERAWSRANRLGGPTLGPLGLLALLEAQLGLGRERPTALLGNAAISRFYEASCQAARVGPPRLSKSLTPIRIKPGEVDDRVAFANDTPL